MVWPIYYRELLRIGHPTSPVGIATGWTICKKITDRIPEELYAVAGQLYTKNGINYLIRNLLANKNIRHLVVCGQDRSGASRELKKVWEGGKSDILDPMISRESLAKLIKNVSLISLVGEESPEKIIAKIGALEKNLPSYGQNEVFPDPEEISQNELMCHFPTDPSVFKIQAKTVAETWVLALKHILRFGEVKETDSMKMKETFNLTAVIEDEDPDNFFILRYLGFDRKKLEEYLPQIVNSKKIQGLHYTYGERLGTHFDINQIEALIEKLKTDPNAREAVGVLFDPRIDIQANHRPCIVLVQALRNQGKLHLNAYARSHDIFGGWPLNAFGLRKLHQKIATKSNLPLGTLTLISASAHIYDFDWAKTKKIVKSHDRFFFASDPRGYFVINTDDRKQMIVVKHFSPEGFELQTFKANISRPKAALELGRKITHSLALSSLDHALDLGIELQKAESALRMGVPYSQDQPFLLKKESL